MIQYINSINGNLEIKEEWFENAWINIVPPHNKQELEKLSSELDIPLDFLTDPLDIEERSRYEKEDNNRLIILTIPLKQGEEENIYYTTIPLGIVITNHNLITISPKENIIVERIVEQKVKNINTVFIPHLILKIFEQTAIWYLEYLKRLNLKRNLLEQELYNSSRNKELKELLKIEKSLVYFLNSLKADELLLLKMNRTDFLKIKDNEDLVDYFEDIIVDYSQALDMANVHTNILSGIMDTYATIISNNFNNLIQRLTYVTIILAVPTLIASFFGMNVIIPLSHIKYSFFYIILISILLGIGLMFILLKRIKI